MLVEEVRVRIERKGVGDEGIGLEGWSRTCGPAAAPAAAAAAAATAAAAAAAVAAAAAAGWSKLDGGQGRPNPKKGATCRSSTTSRGEGSRGGRFLRGAISDLYNEPLA
ncbi:hypothetical protein V1478_005204 [Vespula squamosa]|uniref:Uncharacterized protein n=1 Tax=Vespula squamosa TaxID=30214 RepID=A0ABD2BDH0_VESSQ